MERGTQYLLRDLPTTGVPDVDLPDDQHNIRVVCHKALVDDYI